MNYLQGTGDKRTALSVRRRRQLDIVTLSSRTDLLSSVVYLPSTGGPWHFCHKLLTIVTTAVLFISTGTTVSTQVPNVSGTWTLDRVNSEFPENRSERRGPGRNSGGRGGFGMRPAETLVIQQTAGSFKVEQQSGNRSTTMEYALDGSQTAVEVGRGTLTVTTSWDGQVLVITGTHNIETRRGNLSLDISERNTLSPDGQTLTVERTLGTPRGERTSRLVYRKAV